MMVEATSVEILIDDEDLIVLPGQHLRGGFRVTSADPVYVKKAEISVLWYTEGKGDEDMGVVFLDSVAEGQQLDAQQAFPFDVTVPDHPWSYDGKIVKIRWAVRVRLFPEHGSEIAAEQRFHLLPKGMTAPAGPPTDQEAAED